jgi:hypothetical protein
LRHVKQHERQRLAARGLLAAVLLAAPGIARAQPAKPEAPAGAELAPEARVLMALVACAGGAELPETWPATLLKQHCRVLAEKADKFRRRWVDRVRPYLAQLMPADLPKRVVYPFGGGDLVSALAAFPLAEEFTTISLESAGDVRGLAALGKRQLRASLDATREHLRCLFAVSHSKTTNLKAGARSSLPGEIAFALAAFSVFDIEPVSLRYFRLDGQGNIVYLTASELGEVGAAAPKDGPNPFANVEIAFRPRQEPGAPLRIYRHIRANLDDEHFHANGPLAFHLGAKGDVAALIKAASFLLWFDHFSHIRAYLLDHAVWMLSDATGIPPSLARAAGFEQECYGLFHGPMLAQYSPFGREFLALWRASPKRMLPFYFGYPDRDGHGHMMVTRRTGKAGLAATGEPATDRVSGGVHWRLLTEQGPIHVWQPRGYHPPSAGTVVYVHGYYTNVDGAWVQHALAEQFAASKANALFIVPEAPSSSGEEVAWPVLGELLKEVEKRLLGIKARAPVVVAGHSGAWRTLGPWTEDKRVETFVLLDAFYGNDDKFLSWLSRHPGADEPRLSLVSKDTASRVAPFLDKLPAVRRRTDLPETLHDLTPAERKVAVLELQPDLSHMEIITSGKVLPVLLQRSPLKPVKAPPRYVRHKPSEAGTE